MRRFTKAIGVAALATILLSSTVLAFLYQAPFTIIETAGTDYDMFPATVDANNTFMAANGFMEADALDTRVETLAGTDKPHMVADDRTLGAVPIAANSQTNLFFTTGETDLTSMNIISGYRGFVTIPDSATLEPGDDFRFEFQDTYINTDAGAGKSLLNKQEAVTITISAAGSVKAQLFGENVSSPDADVEVDTVDGDVSNVEGAGATWALIHDAVAGTGVTDSAVTMRAFFQTHPAIGARFTILTRSYVLFDTSAIPDGATITSATLAVTGTAKTDDEPFGDLTLNIFSSSPATDTALVVGDYDQVGVIPFATAITFASFDAAGLNTFTLNAAGLAAIADDGITKFSIREATYDAPDIDPGGGLNVIARFEMATADSANPPVLTVVFEAADVTATGVTTGEHDIVVATLDRGDIDTYATTATIAVNTGAGILPVRLLEEVTLTSAAASVTFSNIDTAVATWDALAGVTSRHLVIVVNAASDQATAAQVVNYRFNGDSGNNYNYQELNGTAAVVAASRSTGVSSMLFISISGTTTANAFDGGTILVPHAFNALNHKATISLGGASETTVQAVAGRWANTSAITSFTIFPTAGNFVSGSTFQLGVVDERYLIEEQILVADGTFTFAGIAAGAGDLTVVGYLRGAFVGTNSAIEHNINGDAVAANYFAQRLRGNAAAADAASLPGNLLAGRVTGTTATANSYGAFLATYSQYADTVNQPHFLTLSGYHDSVAPQSRVMLISGRRSNVAAITQLDYTVNAGADFKDGSMMSLYRVPQFVIERITLAAPAASVTFSDIPQGYEALQLQVYTRTTAAAATGVVDIEFNNDAVAANYNRQFIQGVGAAVGAARDVANPGWFFATGAGATANAFAGGTYYINQYAATDRHKHAIVTSGVVEEAILLMSTRWESLEAINKIVLQPAGGDDFVAGSVFELVGVMPSVELQILIDGAIEGAASTLNVDVPDNANDWLLADNSTTPFLPYMESYEQSGQALHFTGATDSNVNAGAIHNAAAKFWFNLWFKLDNDFTAGSGFQVLFSKTIDINDRVFLILHDTVGDLRMEVDVGGPAQIVLRSAETSWNAGQWYNVTGSMSLPNGARMIVNAGVAVTDANTSGPPNGGDLVVGDLDDPGSLGFRGVIANVAVGTDDLTAAEEVALYGGGIPSRGVIPADANNIWYLDEGTGVVAVDSGLDGNNGAIDAANIWGADGSLFRLRYQPIAIVANTGEAGTADAGTAITLDDAILTQANDFWNGARLIIVTTTDTLAPQGESSVITDFDAALDRLTFDALTAVVDIGDTYTIDYGTLVDRAATTQDGRITWGVNPTGISVTLGSMVASSQPIVGATEAEPARDILPPITVSDWFGDGTVSGTTLTNPIRPLITAMSDNTTLTELLVWRLMGIIAVLFATIATSFTVRQHQGITALVAATILGGLVAFDHNIFPMWTLVIAIGLFIAGIVSERSPSL